MGIKSRIKMLDADYKERIKKVVNDSIASYNQHVKKNYPYSEEDGEGVMTYRDSHHVTMTFKNLSVKDGYDKTVKSFRKLQRFRKIRIYIVRETIEVDF